MATILTHNSPSIAPSISTSGKRPYRKTHNSVVSGELDAPYHVNLGSTQRDGLIHSVGLIYGADVWVTCCRQRLVSAFHFKQCVPSCVVCGICMGCYTCMPGYIKEETMLLGKWETKDGRRLYPFEMDNTHLVNAIAKLKRDKTHFKDDWKTWVMILEHEANLRRLR